MSTFALITWIAAAAFGLFMFAIWLIEYGGRDSGQPASRLPTAVIFGHVLLAGTGLGVWLIYLVAPDDRLADVALGILVCVAALGFTMFKRWLSVYRETTTPPSAAVVSGLYSPAPVEAAAPAQAPQVPRAAPAEAGFPLVVVVGHGLFAAATIVLVLLTVLRS